MIASSYNVQIVSRPLYVNPGDKRTIGEIFDAVFFCQSSDGELDFSMTSDGSAIDSTIQALEYSGLANTQGKIQLVAPAGTCGTFFQYNINKQIPADGVFYFWNMLINFMLQPGTDLDFINGNMISLNGN